MADRGEIQESTVAARGEHDRVPLFTLRGNPGSAYVSFQIFVRSAIAAL
jgi:molybdopterin biosynthesis enzyme